MNPEIFRVSRAEFIHKIEHINLMFKGIGIPLMNDELKDVFLALFDKVQE